MVDIHHHLLHGLDDGADSLETSVEMARQAVAEGITHVVCTPHANSYHDFDPSVNTARVDELRARLADEKIPLTLGLGCDFHMSFDNVKLALADPARFSINGLGYLLVEVPEYGLPPGLTETFFQLQLAGMTPILTHPERNPILQQTPQRIPEWAEQGCLIQVTASSLTGFWGERPEIIARWLLDRSAVHILASDAHDTRRRVPNLSAARAVAEDIVGEEYADALVDGNPGAIVNGMPIPYCPRPVLD